MTPLKRVISASAAVCLGLVLAGCANDGGGMFGATTTASIPEKPKVDPACVTLTSQIDTLRREGIAEKVEKAAAKKYKMTPADFTKAAELNKANAEFQTKCAATSTLTTAMAAPAATAAGESSQTAKPQAALSAYPPVPAGGQ